MVKHDNTRLREKLAAEIGEKIYIDIAKWHLYLREAHLHTEIADRLYPDLDRPITPDQVNRILGEITVSLGGGKCLLPLRDLIPAIGVQDLCDLVQAFQEDL